MFSGLENSPRSARCGGVEAAHDGCTDGPHKKVVGVIIQLGAEHQAPVCGAFAAHLLLAVRGAPEASKDSEDDATGAYDERTGSSIDVVLAPAAVVMSGGPNTRACVHRGVVERVPL